MKKYLHYAWVICFGCAFICALTSPIINATATQYLISVTEEFGVSRSAFTLSSTIVALVGMVFSRCGVKFTPTASVCAAC